MTCDCSKSLKGVTPLANRLLAASNQAIRMILSYSPCLTDTLTKAPVIHGCGHTTAQLQPSALPPPSPHCACKAGDAASRLELQPPDHQRVRAAHKSRSFRLSATHPNGKYASTKTLTTQKTKSRSNRTVPDLSSTLSLSPS